MIDKFIDYLYTMETGAIIVQVCGGIALLYLAITKGYALFKKAHDTLRLHFVSQILEEQKEAEEAKQQYQVQTEVNEILHDLSEFRKEIQEVKSSIEVFNKESKLTEDYRKKNDQRLQNLEDQYEKVIHSIEKTNDSVNRMNTDVHREISSIKDEVQQINKTIPSLIDSDIETFRTYLIDVYTTAKREGSINVYTLKTLINRFKIYTKEGGNSWAEAIVNLCCNMPITTFEGTKEENKEYLREISDFVEEYHLKEKK